jgi:NAD(P)-dependent dehydrogenase (short-subunit alcohol dehydrogenase family)
MSSRAVESPGLLNGKTALVTGASRGLGRAIGLALAGAGATVVGVARNESGLAETVRTIRAQGGRAQAFSCDVTSEASVAAMGSAVADAVGGVDIVVNNAGTAVDAPFLETSLEQFRSTVDVNVVGPFLVTREFGRGMTERRYGKVINIGSVDTVIGVPNLVAYCTSKGAVAQFTRALAAEWARFGVSVNCLCPGYIMTDINFERFQDEDTRRKILSRIPVRRFAEFDDITSWVVFLASDLSNYATGQLFIVDGGESAR